MPEPVLEAYIAGLRAVGNPASTHAHGQAASELLESARERIADALGCDSAEVSFTSGGTESVNTAVKGIYWARRRLGAGPVILVPEGEHHATLEAAEWLRDAQGADLRFLPIDHEGVLHAEVLERAIERAGSDNVALVSFLWANNEVGSVQPVQSLVRVARSAGVPVHVDAVSALGQVPIDFRASGASAVSVSAHKIGGPVGVGALVLGRDVSADPLFHGGSQQRARSGTQNVAGAVAFAAAMDFAGIHPAGHGDEEAADRHAHMATLRDRLIAGVRERVPDAVLRGTAPGAGRLPGNAHFTFPECQGDSLVFLLDAAGISASVGSACQAGVAEVSHVLLAMGVPEVEAIGSLRFTFGADSSVADVEALLAALPQAVARARWAGLS